MKKLFIVLAVASLGFVACNNDSTSTEDAAKLAADSARIADSMKAAKDSADAAAAAATAAAADTMKKVDSPASKK
jgi:hypothetical protein